MNLSCYVAGRVADPVVRAVLGAVKSAGLTITHDWTADGALPKPYVDHAEVNGPHAQAMIDGASRADLFVLCWDAGMLGAAVEWGAALASGATCVIIGLPAGGRQSVFAAHPQVRLFDGMHEFRQWLGQFIRG
jgi:hypothetical protein